MSSTPHPGLLEAMEYILHTSSSATSKMAAARAKYKGWRYCTRQGGQSSTIVVVTSTSVRTAFRFRWSDARGDHKDKKLNSKTADREAFPLAGFESVERSVKQTNECAKDYELINYKLTKRT